MSQIRSLRRTALRPRAGGPATALFLVGLTLSAGAAALGAYAVDSANAQGTPGAAAPRQTNDPGTAAMPSSTGSVRDVSRGAAADPQGANPQVARAGDDPVSRSRLDNDPASTGSVWDAHPEAAHTPNDGVSAPRKLAPGTAVTPEDGAQRTNPKDHLPGTMRRGG